ncbi:MAG TPA: DUF4397 domain-containing protein [Puia sp.]
MKKIKILTGLFIVAALACFFSCKRDMALKNQPLSPAGTALIQIVDVSPNLGTILNANADTFNVLFNGVKMTGNTPGTTTAVVYNSIYPFAGSNNGYASVPAGAQTIKFVKGFNTLDSVVLGSIQETLIPDRHYSLIITDSINSKRDSSKIFIWDSLYTVTAGYFNLRFVNAAWNDTANVDIWSTRNNRALFVNVKPGGIMPFATYGSTAQLTDTLFVRRSGTLIGLDTLNSVSFSNQRSYTLVYKGNALSNNTKDTKRRHLINYLNQ